MISLLQSIFIVCLSILFECFREPPHPFVGRLRRDLCEREAERVPVVLCLVYRVECAAWDDSDFFLFYGKACKRSHVVDEVSLSPDEKAAFREVCAHAERREMFFYRAHHAVATFAVCRAQKFDGVTLAGNPQQGGMNVHPPGDFSLSPAFPVGGIVDVFMHDGTVGGTVVFRPQVFYMDKRPLPAAKDKMLQAR